MVEKFFQLLRYAIGASATAPYLAPGEWPVIHEMSRRQALLGVIFCGIERMDKKPPRDLLLRWIVEVKSIEKRNIHLNKSILELSEIYQRRGWRICVLKGQGNALLHPNVLRRSPGDVDIWIDAPRQDIIRYARGLRPHAKAAYHHVEFPDYKGIEVEGHYRPSYTFHPIYNRRLQQYFDINKEQQFANYVTLEADDIPLTNRVAVPTTEFNLVYQICHIQNHLYDRGIGLRQFVDYYYLLLRWEGGNLEPTFKYIGMHHFAGAVMYVMKEVFAMEESQLILPIDVNRGRFVLNEIMESGNFGSYDNRYPFGRGFIGRNIQRLWRDARLLRYFPSVSLCEPFFRLSHFFWRVFCTK